MRARPRASISMGKSKTKAPTSRECADALREAGSREEAEIEAAFAAAQAQEAHEDAQAKKVATNRFGRKVTEWQVVPPRRKKGAGAGSSSPHPIMRVLYVVLAIINIFCAFKISPKLRRRFFKA